MGVCASCLGSRHSGSLDEDDVSRLLDDPSNFQYGSFADQNANIPTDPLESQRETEALQNVVAKTANNLVDIFEIAPQGTNPAALSGQDIRLARYQSILSKLSPDDETFSPSAVQGHLDWLSDDDMMDTQGKAPSIKEGREPLVGTFGDAAATETVA